jgi:hypothetical protein
VLPSTAERSDENKLTHENSLGDDYVTGYYVEANRPFSSAMASISSKYDDMSAGLADEM